MKQETVVGQGIPVYDAALKVSGQLRYVDDISLPGMLHAKVLLSPVPHAEIRRIDTSAAEQLPGVRAVACYKNTPSVPFNSTTRFFLSSPAPIENERIFDRRVRFVGDRVAAVAADTAEIASRALELIQVEYDPLPYYVDPEEAMAAGAFPIHGEDNVACRVERNAGDVEQGFQEAEVICEHRYTTPAEHHCAIEPHTAIAHMDAQGKLTLIAPFQNNFGERIVLSRIFGLPLSRIRVVSPAIGGAFGGKMEASMELIPAALTMLCRRPVKLTLTRRECMVATRCRHASVTHIKTGLKRDGTIVAQEIRVITNTGAYASSAANVIGAMSAKVFKSYRTPNLRFVGLPVYTNTPVAGAMRGYGSPQVYFALQCHMLHIARAMGIDYTELQRRNMVDPDGVDQSEGHPIGNPRPKDCLDRALELRKNWPPVPEEPGWRIGEGWALGAHGSGVYGSQVDQTCVIVKMNDDGTCVLNTGTHDMGNGSVTAQMQIVSEVLGIPMDWIGCVAADTDVCGWNLGDFSSRGVYVSCHAAKRAAEAAAEQLRREAAALLGERAEEIRLQGGRAVGTASGRSAALSEVMNHAQSVSKREIVGVATYASAHTPGSYGVHIVRVRVHEETEAVEVLDYIAVHDVGRVINRLGVEGQLQGGIQMGIGYALQEAMTFDEKGRLRRSSLHSYQVPRASQMPRLQMDFIEAGEPTGPYGAKSISECAVVPAAPAVLNAVSDALGRNLYAIPHRPRGEVEQTLRLRPDQRCVYCGLCARRCPQDAITVDRARKLWQVNEFRCLECGLCAAACPKHCLQLNQPAP